MYYLLFPRVHVGSTGGSVKKKSRLRDGIKQFKKEAKKLIKNVLERTILVLTHKNESGVKVPTKVTNPASYESACKGENLKWSAGNSLVR